MQKTTRKPEAIFVLIASIILFWIGVHGLSEGQIAQIGSRTGGIIEWEKQPKYFCFIIFFYFFLGVIGVFHGLTLLLNIKK